MKLGILALLVLDFPIGQGKSLRKLVRVACEGFGGEILVRKPQAAECISDSVVDAFDVREFGTKLFDDDKLRFSVVLP